MITRKNLLYSTFVGLEVEISNSSQQGLIGQKGIVVDETKNLLIMKTGKKELKIPKTCCTFVFTTEDDDKVEVEGKRIAFRPHERPKKV